MYSFYRNLKPLYRRLIHAFWLILIFLLPAIWREPQNMPSGMMPLWILSFFAEVTCILMSHNIGLDYMEINVKGIQKIQRMKPEKKKKKAAELDKVMKRLVIRNAGIRLKKDEDCIYKGEAVGVMDPKIIKAYLQDDAPEGIEEKAKDSCPGLLYITNQRMIFEGARNRFNLTYPEIRQAQYYGKFFVIYTKDYPYVFETKDKKNVIYSFNIINEHAAALEY